MKSGSRQAARLLPCGTRRDGKKSIWQVTLAECTAEAEAGFGALRNFN